VVKFATMVTLVTPFARLVRVSAIITWNTKAEESLIGLTGTSVVCLHGTQKKVEHAEVKLGTVGDLKIWSRTWTCKTTNMKSLDFCSSSWEGVEAVGNNSLKSWRSAWILSKYSAIVPSRRLRAITLKRFWQHYKDVEYHWSIIILPVPKHLNTSHENEKFVLKVSEW